MNTQAHKVIEVLLQHKDPAAKHLATIYKHATIFDAGKAVDIPRKAKNAKELIARPPYNATIIKITLGPESLFVFCIYDNDIQLITAVIVLDCTPKPISFASTFSYLSGEINCDNASCTDISVIQDSLSIVLNFFEVLACSNVTTVDVEAPHALNKKRIKAGKLPIKSHKVLHLVAPSTHTDSPSQGGTHASPRVHLRRGHIRKLPNGTTVWVQQAVVGSKHGIVTKDYSVSYSGAPA